MNKMVHEEALYEPFLAASAFPAEDFFDLGTSHDSITRGTTDDGSATDAFVHHPAWTTPRLAQDFDSFDS